MEVMKYINGDIAESSVRNEEPMEEEDKARSEATLRFVVNNFSKCDTVFSPPTYVRNLPWKIMVWHKTKPGPDGSPTQSIGFFLKCSNESESSTWSCNANATLRLISQKEGVEAYERKICSLFCREEDDWGNSNFMPWTDFTDPEKGYIKDDTVIFEVTVVADVPSM